MEGGEDLREKLAVDNFTRTVLSWSLDDIYDENLYKYQVKKIPDRFDSVSHYLGSFVYPLLEETRESICSGMEDIGNLPYAEVTDVRETKPKGEGFYHVRVDQWRNRFHDRGKEPYSTSPGDLLILVDAKPETVSDLQRIGFSWRFASVSRMTYGDYGCDNGDLTTTSLSFKVIVTKGTEVAKGMHKQMFAIFIENLTTEKRIWNALHMSKNWNILEKLLSPDSLVRFVFLHLIGLPFSFYTTAIMLVFLNIQLFFLLINDWKYLNPCTGDKGLCVQWNIYENVVD